jgi:hypothetical protein
MMYKNRSGTRVATKMAAKSISASFLKNNKMCSRSYTLPS